MDMSAGAASLCSALLFVSLLLFVSAEQKTITAESGKTVTLSCRAPNKHNIRAVVWSKAGSRNGKNVLVYQFVVQDSMKEHSSFKNRAELKDRQMKDGDVSVILKHVDTTDTGTYECRVYMRERLRLLSIIYLRVDPPGQTRGLRPREDAGKEEAGKEDAGKEEAGKEEAGKEEAGKEDAGKEDAGKEDGSAGLLIGPLVFLIVSAVLVAVSGAVTVVVGVCVGVVVMCKGGTSRGSYRFSNQ